ncbi:unnamed protein product [Lactuca virosa]|uniref:RING-type domain-containing protein n=1 Tax=Lactuca virosa TaxID=75947 RepID=A0AAU9N7L3_9ASTR|nr:unnamed protein product [Lactuca virosa]
MSNHNNINTQRSLRLANDANAWYNNGGRDSFLDIISPPSRLFPHILNERVGIDPWLWSFENRIFTLPSSIMSFPQPRMRLVVLQNNLANHTNLRSREMDRSQTQTQLQTRDSNNQTKALEKLRKEIYNPIPKKIIQRLGRFYSEKDGGKTTKEVYKEDDDYDNKRCVICLEDFEAKQVVMVTPCNHTFHEQCILPWVRTHGRCPVCRFSFL